MAGSGTQSVGETLARRADARENTDVARIVALTVEQLVSIVDYAIAQYFDMHREDIFKRNSFLKAAELWFDLHREDMTNEAKLKKFKSFVKAGFLSAVIGRGSPSGNYGYNAAGEPVTLKALMQKGFMMILASETTANGMAGPVLATRMTGINRQFHDRLDVQNHTATSAIPMTFEFATQQIRDLCNSLIASLQECTARTAGYQKGCVLAAILSNRFIPIRNQLATLAVYWSQEIYPHSDSAVLRPSEFIRHWAIRINPDVSARREQVERVRGWSSAGAGGGFTRYQTTVLDYAPFYATIDNAIQSAIAAQASASATPTKADSCTAPRRQPRGVPPLYPRDHLVDDEPGASGKTARGRSTSSTSQHSVVVTVGYTGPTADQFSTTNVCREAMSGHPRKDGTYQPYT